MKHIWWAVALSFATQAHAQRTVTETSTEYRSAPHLKLVQSATWCGSAEASGCDYSDISHAVALDQGGVLLAGRRGPIRQFSRAGGMERELSR